MKIFFFLTLLINIALFFWGFSSNKSNPPEIKNPKQILLLSEVKKQTRKQSFTPNNIQPANKIDSTVLKSNLIDKKEESIAPLLPSSTSTIPSTKKILLVEKSPISTPIIKTKAISNKEKSLVSDSSKKDKKTALNDKLCYQVGPFKNMGDLRIWTRANKIKENTFSHINKGQQKGSKYLVYLPAADSPEQTKKDIDDLKQRAITDYFLFRKGDLKGAISLGVFVKEKRAKLQQSQFRDKGLELKITPLYAKGAIIFAQFLTDDKGFEKSVAISGKEKIIACK